MSKQRISCDNLDRVETSKEGQPIPIYRRARTYLTKDEVKEMEKRDAEAKQARLQSR